MPEAEDEKMFDEPAPAVIRSVDPERRANNLDGREWTRNSISVWNDIRYTAEEQRLKHPAMFPSMLAERLIRCFTNDSDSVVLDPFMGSGSTLVAARNQGKQGIGFELYDKFADLAEHRLHGGLFGRQGTSAQIHRTDARFLTSVLEPDSVDFAFTSPPYWDILVQKRTADSKDIRTYGDNSSDLGLISNYAAFLDQLDLVFRGVLTVLKPGKYFIVNVMDLRKKDQFFPYHMDVAQRCQTLGFDFDDLIIWDRRQEYNNLRCLGYPYTFRLNKIHEFLIILRKP